MFLEVSAIVAGHRQEPRETQPGPVGQLLGRPEEVAADDMEREWARRTDDEERGDGRRLQDLGKIEYDRIRSDRMR